jgi:hypothetical protein
MFALSNCGTAPYIRTMMTSTKPSRPIEFSGSIEALAVSLGLPVAEVVASLGALIRAGHLQRVSGNTWRLKPAR